MDSIESKNNLPVLQNCDEKLNINTKHHCLICKIDFARKENLTRHVNVDHEKALKYAHTALLI